MLARCPSFLMPVSCCYVAGWFVADGIANLLYRHPRVDLSASWCPCPLVVLEGKINIITIASVLILPAHPVLLERTALVLDILEVVYNYVL